MGQHGSARLSVHSRLTIALRVYSTSEHLRAIDDPARSGGSGSFAPEKSSAGMPAGNHDGRGSLFVTPGTERRSVTLGKEVSGHGHAGPGQP